MRRIWIFELFGGGMRKKKALLFSEFISLTAFVTKNYEKNYYCYALACFRY